MTQRTRLPLQTSSIRSTPLRVQKMKTSDSVSTLKNSQTPHLDFVDMPNIYAAARAERSRAIRAWFSSKKAAKTVNADQNADGLAPLGMAG